MSDWSDIGEKLKESREAQNLSLQDVAHKTRIPVPSLKAIEANYYSVFPSPTYAKSFVQQYADYLDFDADEWLDNFQTGNVLANSDSIEYLDQPGKKTSKVATAPKRQSSTQNIPQESLGQPLLLLFITGGLIAAGLWGFQIIEKRLNPEKPISPVQTEKEATPSPLGVETPRAPINPSPGPGTIPPPSELPIIVFSQENPAPRAIIVEDDEQAPAPLTPDPIAGD